METTEQLRKKLETAIRWELQRLKEDRKKITRHMLKFCLFCVLTLPILWLTSTKFFVEWVITLNPWLALALNIPILFYIFTLSHFLLKGLENKK